MDEAPVNGTQGYDEHADELVRTYESVSFADVHQGALHVLPAKAGVVLDIGAGTGRDAAAFAAMGHRVLAVEPLAAFRAAASRLHPSPRIEWLDDSLPALARVVRRAAVFDVIMLSAVWMHLDADARAQAMTVAAGLTRTGGLMILSLRHGPIPPGRRMFAVTADETVQLAEAAGFRTEVRLENQPSRQSQVGVSWTRLVFRT